MSIYAPFPTFGPFVTFSFNAVAYHSAAHFADSAALYNFFTMSASFSISLDFDNMGTLPLLVLFFLGAAQLSGRVNLITNVYIDTALLSAVISKIPPPWSSLLSTRSI